MSLFPAYDKCGGTDGPQEIKDATSWLDNSSFTASVSKLQPRHFSSSDSSDLWMESNDCSSTPSDYNTEPLTKKCKTDAVDENKSVGKKSRKGKKEKKKKKDKLLKKIHKKCKVPALDISSTFILDIEPNLLLLKMSEIDKRSRPRYQCPCKCLPGVFAVKLELKKKKKKKILRYFSKKVVSVGQDDETTGQELTKTVEELNRAVHEDPSDISNWLKLVSFQDDYFKFQPIRYKTVAERDRAANMQKLSILERAISTNADHELLQRTWLKLALDYCTNEEVTSKLSSLLTERGSMVLFLGSIMAIQQSMTRCTYPAVTKCYKQVMQKLQRSKRLPSDLQDNFTLELLLYFCTFLQQCGLWEVSWMTIKLTLSLNLSLALPAVDESEVVILEEENRIIGGSADIPLWNLWPKLETLRQGCHFLPVLKSENFFQRVVAVDDVSELVYHVRKVSLFRLLLLLPLLAKVPFLPRYHSFLSSVCSQLPPWVFDGVEQHLAASFMQSPLLNVNTSCLSHHLPQSHAPQYLRRLPGQLLFLNFASNLFDMVLGAVNGRERVLIGVWYLRFLRWLDRLARMGRYEPPAGRPKTKSLFKEFLKKEINRDTILFYVEYGLWEFENGDTAGAIKILDTLARSRNGVLDQANEESKSYLCYLYRSLCEVQIAAGRLDEAKSTLQRLAGASNSSSVLLKLKHVALEAVNAEEVDDFDLMLPCFNVDWIACYVWYLALSGLKDKAVDFVKEAINTAKGGNRELLYEVLVLLMKNFKKEHERGDLSVAHEAIKEFPLNAMFSAVVAECLIERGGLWWKESYHLLHEPASLGAVTLACATLERSRMIEMNNHRCRTMFTRLTMKEGKASAVLHRMFLKFLFEAGDVAGVEEARVLALEACPWNKSLYMDAIAVSPSELTALTDLMVEKDFRVHITPDEIDFMRD